MQEPKDQTMTYETASSIHDKEAAFVKSEHCEDVHKKTCIMTRPYDGVTTQTSLIWQGFPLDEDLEATDGGEEDHGLLQGIRGLSEVRGRNGIDVHVVLMYGILKETLKLKGKL